jgi:hypothetical protein
MDFITCIARSFPNVSASCVGDSSIYENVVWESGNALPSKKALEAAEFENVKTDKIEELSNLCNIAITGGFTSDALGGVYLYDSAEVDQLNLIGAAAATAPVPGMPEGFSSYYAARELVNDIPQPKVYLLHTHFQIRKVLQDGSVFKLSKLQMFNDKRNFVRDEATTVEQVRNITF